MAILAFLQIQLIPDGTIFIHIALILLMIWILNRTFFRPINKIMESRDRNTGGRSTEAQEILSQVHTKNAAFDAEIRDTRTEGYAIIEQQRSKAIAKRQTKVEEVKAEVSELLATEKGAIGKQTAEAQKSVAAEAKKLAEKISANILKA